MYMKLYVFPCLCIVSSKLLSSVVSFVHLFFFISSVPFNALTYTAQDCRSIVSLMPSTFFFFHLYFSPFFWKKRRIPHCSDIVVCWTSAFVFAYCQLNVERASKITKMKKKRIGYISMGGGVRSPHFDPSNLH